MKLWRGPLIFAAFWVLAVVGVLLVLLAVVILLGPVRLRSRPEVVELETVVIKKDAEGA